jgi:hypothetical protein
MKRHEKLINIGSIKEGHKMEMTKKLITPAMAKDLLDTANNGNRSLSSGNVAKFAADMREGKWRDTHQNVIAFYDDGTLADGQHRLAAISASGVPMMMFVATGLSREDGSMIDQGRTRSVADALKIGGLLSSDKYSTYAVAIVKLIRAAETRMGNAMSISQTAVAIEAIRDGVDFSCAHLSGVQCVGLRNATMRAAVAAAFYNVNVSKLDQFCRVMTTGMPEDFGDEMLVRFRNKLLMDGATKGGQDRIERYQLICKVIDAYNRGISLSRFNKSKGNVFELGVFS